MGENVVQIPVQGAFGEPPTSCMQFFASFGFDGYFTILLVIKFALIGLPLSSDEDGPVDQRSSQLSSKISRNSNTSAFHGVPASRLRAADGAASAARAASPEAASGIAGGGAGFSANSWSAAWRPGLDS